MNLPPPTHLAGQTSATQDAAAGQATPTSRPSSPYPKHDLPLEIWSLVVSYVAITKRRDPKWRLHLARLAHTCKSAYFAAFPILWSFLHLQFVRNNTELAPAASTVANAAEYHGDPHLEYRLAWIRYARRQFDTGMVFPSACTRANRQVLARMAAISECLLLAPLVIRRGMPYLVSLVESEQRQVDLAKIRVSVERLWGPFLSAQPALLNNIAIVNGLVLVPFPLHLVKHIAINDLDTSVDLGTDLLHPITLSTTPAYNNTPAKQEWAHSHHRPPPSKPSWTHVLPFLLQLPPTNIHSIRFLTSSPSASRLKAELVHRYPFTQNKEAVYSGDHEHRFPSMTPSTRNVRLFLDGDLDSAASSTPDLICIPSFDHHSGYGDVPAGDAADAASWASSSAAPSGSLPFKPTTPDLTVHSIEYLGRTSYLPFDEPGVGLHHIFTIPTLRRLVFDIDFDFDTNDAGSFPIHLPNLVHFTLTMRIATLIFARNQHLHAPHERHLPAGQPAFPALRHMTLLNDLEYPAGSSPSVSSTSSSSSFSPPAPSPPRLPLMPAIPFHHMPHLYEFTVPTTFRGLPAPCAIDISVTPPPIVSIARMPNVSFIGMHDLPQHVPTDRPPIFDALTATYKRIETQYALRAMPFPNLKVFGLHVWGWEGDPREVLPWCTWKDQLREVELVFDGPRTWGSEWIEGVAEFSKMTRLSLVQSVSVGAVRLAPAPAPAPAGERVALDSLEVLHVQFPKARVVDFAGVTIGGESEEDGSARLNLPNLRTLVVQAPCTTHLPAPEQLARLRRISVYGAPCPKLIQSLLASACISPTSTHMEFDAHAPPSTSTAATVHDHGFVYQARTWAPEPKLTCCGSSESPPARPVTWVYAGRRNVRVWYALLTAAPMACAPTSVTIVVNEVMDRVDAGTVVRAVVNVAGDRRAATGWVVKVEECVARASAETVENARWVAETVGGRVAVGCEGE